MTKLMPAGAGTDEIYLNPGDFHFGDGDARIHTLLGSCVAITLWHPVFRIGGMCHFVLPGRGWQEDGKPDGRYGDEAMGLFMAALTRFNTRPGEYQAKIFGGGNMFQALNRGKASSVGKNNVRQARALLHGAGFEIVSEDVGGSGHRRVIFDLRDGNVWVRHDKPTEKSAA